MSILDYNIFYKTELSLKDPWPAGRWDVFISAYNSSERVKITFDKVPARRKCWVIHNEYSYSSEDIPPGDSFRSTKQDEASFIKELVSYIQQSAGEDISKLSICVDVTGFMRPHLLFLALYFWRSNVPQFDILYTEPQRYAQKELTTFSEGAISVRQVAGYEGINSPDFAGDLLIVASGYDHRLIKAVAEHKDKADKIQIFGLPSLRADMYQENVLNAHRASDALGVNKTSDVASYFAPANDPFVTASTLHEIVERRSRVLPISNLYLSPLATKPQALGFALFYIGECEGKNASILFPVSSRYSRETSIGLSRVWMYTIEYPLF
jgi:hypothetical protein